MSVIPKNLQAVHRRIDLALQQAQRKSGSVTLVAVSKTFAADAILEAAACGQRDFGENYLQEALPKMSLVSDALARLGGTAPVWHMTGPLQSNKTRAVAEHFDWAHGLERIKIAERLSSQRPAGRPPLKVCLQINISNQASKSGITPEQLPALSLAVQTLPGLELRGLMAIPAPGDTGAFGRMAALAATLAEAGVLAPDLSMGMSLDLEAAILSGATLVRIGTAIFGQRAPAAASDVALEPHPF